MKILLIEDDMATAFTVELILASKKLKCDHANLGVQGAIKGKTHEYNLIILDLMLPDIDGFEVLTRLRSAHVRSIIIVLSSLSSPEYKIRALKLGADNYFTKPFDKTLITYICEQAARLNESSEFVMRPYIPKENLNENQASPHLSILEIQPKDYNKRKIRLIRQLKKLLVYNNIISLKFS